MFRVSKVCLWVCFVCVLFTLSLLIRNKMSSAEMTLEPRRAAPSQAWCSWWMNQSAHSISSTYIHVSQCSSLIEAVLCSVFTTWELVEENCFASQVPLFKKKKKNFQEIFFFHVWNRVNKKIVEKIISGFFPSLKNKIKCFSRIGLVLFHTWRNTKCSPMILFKHFFQNFRRKNVLKGNFFHVCNLKIIIREHFVFKSCVKQQKQKIRNNICFVFFSKFQEK